MKKHHGFLLLFLIVGIIWIISKKAEQPTASFVPAPPLDKNVSPLDINPEKSAVGTKENPLARMQYEASMLADPQTGQIPENIRRRELHYVEKIPRRSKSHAYRMSKTFEEDWKSIGPYNVGGRTRALAIDVSDES